MIIGKYGLKNGKIVPLDDLKLPFFDLGFLRGYSVFQFMEAHNGVIFYEKERIRNLFNYCKEALIDIRGVDYIQNLPGLLKKLIKKKKFYNKKKFLCFFFFFFKKNQKKKKSPSLFLLINTKGRRRKRKNRR